MGARNKLLALRRQAARTLGQDRPLESKPLLEHLKDLRRVLLVCLAAVSLAFLAVFLGLAKELTALVTQPLLDMDIQVIFTGVSEAFTAQTKLSLIAGVVLASPVIFVSIWLFLRPALQLREQLALALALLAGLALFALGVFFAYKYVFYLAVNFFVYAGEGVARPMISLGTYVGFLFGFLIPFGVVFQMPLVIVILARLGVVTTKAMVKARKYVIFAIFIAAAILTPPDVVSQVMLGLPLWALFEVGVLLSRLVKPRGAVRAKAMAAS